MEQGENTEDVVVRIPPGDLKRWVDDAKALVSSGSAASGLSEFTNVVLAQRLLQIFDQYMVTETDLLVELDATRFSCNLLQNRLSAAERRIEQLKERVEELSKLVNVYEKQINLSEGFVGAENEVFLGRD